ncbi:hypothetical protein DAY19_04620 [Halobacteriovorax vibrionivorans]|uniref:Uncharacterized protein n=1 Tax=Halobacteriovorax vibrionivorans TaxID=2152716 RepID=A0ABY0IKP2_9BACT|nr:MULTISPECIES: hypothetical protein [Halobacteriovorax]RZF23060.1 hypothetical protein DAY19_04620 [Halobacteriovorax vibrionivorans]TGD49309.1 hypothetical protein EP118_00465 [Halobacteriovorax sp. Y22]
MALFDPKWIKPMALAMSLPSTALIVAWGLWEMVDANIITQSWAIFIFLAAIGNILISMVIFALKKK